MQLLHPFPQWFVNAFLGSPLGFLSALPLSFWEFTNDIKSTSQRNENIMVLSVFPTGCRIMTPLSNFKKARFFWSSSTRLAVGLWIWTNPNNFPTCALVKQFCSFLYLVIRYKKPHAYAHNFSVSCFSSSDIHQSQDIDGCQAIGINSSFIGAFWAFHFWYLLYHLISSWSLQ